MKLCASISRITLALTILTVLALPATALEPIIYNGSDLWITPGDGTTFADFRHIPVPADFFCSGSVPFAGKIIFEGVPLKTEPADVLGPTDTIVHRLDNAVFDENGFASTRIQMAAMEFRGIEPFRNECGTFEVGVVLEGEQPITEMRIYQDGLGHGHFEADISVNIRMTFTPVDHAGPQLSLYRNLAFAPSINVWSNRPGDGIVHRQGFFHVDTDSDRIADTFIPGSSRNFVAGYAGKADRGEILRRGFGRAGTEAAGSLRAGSLETTALQIENGMRNTAGSIIYCPGGCHCSDDCGIHCPVVAEEPVAY